MYDRITVPLDGSTFGREALPAARAVARRSNGTLRLVHVHAMFPPIEGEQPSRPFLEMEEEAREADRERLGVLAAGLADEGFAVETELLEGPVVETLAADVNARADLVVMSTHGRGAFSRFWLGSVADGLIRSAETPVLLIRPDEDRAEAAPEPSVESILVTLDGSRLSEQILGPAGEFARLFGARLRLLQVIPPVMAPGFAYPDLPVGLDAASVEDLKASAAAGLKRVAGKLEAEGHEVEADVLVDPRPAAAILDACQETGPSLVAMATHGRGGLRRVVLGSVTDKVVRGADRPVLVYRPRPADTG
ncbi:MAG: universal stress protein [Gemmatimonadota bacterium]